MKTLNKITLAVFLSLFFLESCQQRSESSLIARVDGDSISLSEFKSRLSEYLIGTPPQLGPLPEDVIIRKEVLNELIEEKAFLTEAQKRKIEVPQSEIDLAVKAVEKDYPGTTFDDFLKQQHISRSRYRERVLIRLTLEKLMKVVTQDVPTPSPEEINAYYTENTPSFKKDAQIQLQQIVLKNETEAKTASEQIAEGTAFEVVAQKLSFTPEATQGGNVGWVSVRSLPKEISNILFKTNTNVPSEPIRTDYGFHIIKVLDRHAEKMLTVEEATPEITRILLESAQEKRFSSWRRDLLSKVHVERNHALLANLR